MKLINLLEEEHLDNLVDILKSKKKEYFFDGKKYRIHDIHDLKEYFEFHGFKMTYIGSGYFSSAYSGISKNEEYILKISKSGSRFIKDGWFTYAKHIKGSTNPLFPNILFYGVIKSKIMRYDFGIGIVEYLETGKSIRDKLITQDFNIIHAIRYLI